MISKTGVVLDDDDINPSLSITAKVYCQHLQDIMIKLCINRL